MAIKNLNNYILFYLIIDIHNNSTNQKKKTKSKQRIIIITIEICSIDQQ